MNALPRTVEVSKLICGTYVALARNSTGGVVDFAGYKRKPRHYELLRRWPSVLYATYKSK